MNVFLLLGFVVAVVALIATPGPNLFLMITHSMRFGRSAILPNAAGGVSAALILIALALFGVAQFVPKSALPYLSLIGGLYLLFLGWQNWRSAKRILPQDNQSPTDNDTPHFFREAFLTGLSNPKDLLFFILFLPQFVDPNLALWQGAAVLMLLWFVCDFGIMCGVGLLADVLKSVLTGQRQFIMARVLSVIMMALGSILFMSTVFALVW